MHLESISEASPETSIQGTFQIRPHNWNKISFKSIISKHLEEYTVTHYFFFFNTKENSVLPPPEYFKHDKLENE